MLIETKYGNGDTVWVMNNGKPICLKVRQVSVTVDRWHTFGKTTERYFLANGETAFCHNEWYDEKNIYSSKEELLQTL